MSRRDFTFYIGSLSGVAIVYLVVIPLISGSIPRQANANYLEECLGEGCSDHEVQELCSSYTEECLNEGCSKEEVFELGGQAGGTCRGVTAMLEHFGRIGCRVNLSDFDGACPIICEPIDPREPTAKCYGIILVCNDHCRFPDGSMGTPYVCGLCLGFWF
jgi:hypothetical protein